MALASGASLPALCRVLLEASPALPRGREDVVAQTNELWGEMPSRDGRTAKLSFALAKECGAVGRGGGRRTGGNSL